MKGFRTWSVKVVDTGNKPLLTTLFARRKDARAYAQGARTKFPDKEIYVCTMQPRSEDYQQLVVVKSEQY